MLRKEWERTTNKTYYNVQIHTYVRVYYAFVGENRRGYKLYVTARGYDQGYIYIVLIHIVLTFSE